MRVPNAPKRQMKPRYMVKNPHGELPKNAGEAIKPKTGRKSAWELSILPNRDKILDFYAKGATQERICVWLGIAKDAWHRALHNHPEFRELMTRARMQILHEVRGALISAALGGEREIKSIQKNPDGTETKRIQKIRVEPNVPAAVSVLKNAGEWSDNPVVDNAFADAVKSQKNFRAAVLSAMNLPADAPVRSTVADALGENEGKDVVDDDELAGFGA